MKVTATFIYLDCNKEMSFLCKISNVCVKISLSFCLLLLTFPLHATSEGGQSFSGWDLSIFSSPSLPQSSTPKEFTFFRTYSCSFPDSLSLPNRSFSFFFPAFSFPSSSSSSLSDTIFFFLLSDFSEAASLSDSSTSERIRTFFAAASRKEHYYMSQ